MRITLDLIGNLFYPFGHCLMITGVYLSFLRQFSLFNYLLKIESTIKGFDDKKLVWSSSANHTWSSGKFMEELGWR